MATLQSISDCPPFPEIEGVEFRHVDKFLGYAVSDDGVVWSCRQPHNTKMPPSSWHRLRTSRDNYGYQQVNVYCVETGKRYLKRVHVLVCEAFHGPRPEGLNCCHGEEGYESNRSGNLRWDTQSSNLLDAVRQGTFSRNRPGKRGETNHKAKLTNEDVRGLRLLKGHMLVKDIAAMYGLSVTHTGQILRGEARRYG